MTVWGKILGSAACFTLGGPLGALVGAVTGHPVDRSSRADEDPTQNIAFTIGVIALAAKMARADGVVKRVEVDTFRRLFRVPDGELEQVGRVFDLARRSHAGFEPYARQIAGLFDQRHAVLEELLDSLLAIAEADDELHAEEAGYLREVGRIFGFTDAEFDRILAGHHIAGTRDGQDPYQLLGVSRGASEDAIRDAHRRLVREHHPDLLIAQGMPPEFVALATRKLADINAALDRIRRERRVGIASA